METMQPTTNRAGSNASDTSRWVAQQTAEVSFSVGSGRIPLGVRGASFRSQFARSSAWAKVLFCMMSYLLGIAWLSSVLAEIGVTRSISYQASILIATLCLFAWILKHLHYRSTVLTSESRELPQASARVRFVGPRLDTLKDGALYPGPFEPDEFYATFVCEPSRWMKLSFMITTAIITFMSGLVWHGNALLLVPISLLLASLTRCFWPTYFRVSPGTLLVTRHDLFRNKCLKLNEYDLTTSSVTIDLNRSYLFIEGRTGNLVAEYDILLLPRKSAFAQMVVRACISGTEIQDMRQ